MKQITAYYFLYWISIDICLGQSCSRSLPIYNSSSFAGGNFTSAGGIQLLLPSMNFTCQGVITEWSAHVTGNTSVSDSIEFQIFEPVNSNDLYRLKYGNPYSGNNALGSMITRPVSVVTGPLIPVRPGDVVGVYLPPNSVAELNLLYEYGGETDVLYWNNIGNTMCNYSLCSGKVITGLDLLIGWEFVETALDSFESTLSFYILSNPFYCQGSVVDCDLSIITTGSSVAISSFYDPCITTPSIITTGSSASFYDPSITTLSIVSASNSVLLTTTTTTAASSEISTILIAGGITAIMFLMCVIILSASLLYVVIMKNRVITNASITEYDKRDNTEDTIDPTTNPAYNTVTVHSHAVYDEIVPSEQTLHSGGSDITSQPNGVGQTSNCIGPDDLSVDEENYYY